MTRCSAAAAAGWPDASGMPAGRDCVRDIGCGGSTQGRPDLDVFAATTDAAVASAAAQPAVPRRRLRLRVCPPGTVRSCTPGTGTAPGGPTSTAGCTTRRQIDAARPGRIVPDPALRAVAAGGGSVLPLPRQHLESERATRHRRIRPRGSPRSRRPPTNSSGSTCWARS